MDYVLERKTSVRRRALFIDTQLRYQRFIEFKAEGLRRRSLVEFEAIFFPNK